VAATDQRDFSSLNPAARWNRRRSSQKPLLRRSPRPHEVFQWRGEFAVRRSSPRQNEVQHFSSVGDVLGREAEKCCSQPMAFCVNRNSANRSTTSATADKFLGSLVSFPARGPGLPEKASLRITTGCIVSVAPADLCNPAVGKIRLQALLANGRLRSGWNLSASLPIGEAHFINLGWRIVIRVAVNQLFENLFRPGSVFPARSSAPSPDSPGHPATKEWIVRPNGPPAPRGSATRQLGRQILQQNSLRLRGCSLHRQRE